MEFSRGKRIFNLFSSSTSGNSVKKAKKEIQNAELLLNYCCNKPSTTSDSNLINEIKSYNHDTQDKENNISLTSDEEESENLFLPISSSSPISNLHKLNNEVIEMLNQCQVYASDFPIMGYEKENSALDNYAIDFNTEPGDVAFESEVVEIEPPKLNEVEISQTNVSVPEENEETAAAIKVPNKIKKSISKINRISIAKEKHPLLPASCKCTTDCKHIIEEDTRHQIHEEFWKLHYNERKAFIFSMVRKENVKRKRTSDNKRQRNISGLYTHCNILGSKKLNL